MCLIAELKKKHKEIVRSKQATAAASNVNIFPIFWQFYYKCCFAELLVQMSPTYFRTIEAVWLRFLLNKPSKIEWLIFEKQLMGVEFSPVETALVLF